MSPQTLTTLTFTKMFLPMRGREPLSLSVWLGLATQQLPQITADQLFVVVPSKGVCLYSSCPNRFTPVRVGYPCSPGAMQLLPTKKIIYMCFSPFLLKAFANLKPCLLLAQRETLNYREIEQSMRLIWKLSKIILLL